MPKCIQNDTKTDAKRYPKTAPESTLDKKCLHWVRPIIYSILSRSAPSETITFRLILLPQTLPKSMTSSNLRKITHFYPRGSTVEQTGLPFPPIIYSILNRSTPSETITFRLILLPETLPKSMTSSNLQKITHFLTPRLKSGTKGITFSTNLAPRGTVTSSTFHPWDSRGAPNVPHWLPVLILDFKITISQFFSNTFTPWKLLKKCTAFHSF